MNTLTIVLIVTLVSIVSFSCLYTAFADEYTYLGIKHKESPMVCIFEPHPEYTDTSEELIHIAEESVNLWEDALQTYIPSGNWVMERTIIPIEEHHLKSPYDFPECNILLAFEYSGEDGTLGYTHVNFSKSWHKYTHATVFLNALNVSSKVNIILGNGGDVNIGSDISLDKLSLPVIQNIMTHEFGHTLGVGHYEITDHPVSKQPWLTRSVMYHALDPYNDEIMVPQYVDAKMVELLYDSDGFGGEVPPRVAKVAHYSPGDVELCTFKCGISR